MQMAVIIDLFLAVVLVLCTVLGFRRGAFKSVIGIVIVVAALIGAGFVSAQGAPAAAKALTPLLTEQIEARRRSCCLRTQKRGKRMLPVFFPLRASIAKLRMIWRAARRVR